MIVEIRFDVVRTPDTYFIDCRDDVAKNIKKLQNEFDIWCNNLSNDHPIKQYHEQTLDGEVISSGYAVCIRREDFPNWLNEKYGQQVAKIVNKPLIDPSIIISF